MWVFQTFPWCFSLIFCVSGFVEFVAAGGDTHAEYVLTENQNQNLDGGFSISFKVPELPTLEITLPEFNTSLETFILKLPLLKQLQPDLLRNPSIPDDYQEIPFPVPSIPELRPPKCNWESDDMNSNPQNDEGDCDLECSMGDRKIRYNIGGFLFAANYVCCCA